MAWVVVGRVVPQGAGGGPAIVDSVGFAMEYAVTDVMAIPTDSYAMAIVADYADQMAVPVEALTFALSGFDDVMAIPTDSRDSLLIRWATTTLSGGTTVPTNPADALGMVNGIKATCKAGGLANGTSTLGVNIVAPMPEIASGASRTFRAYYAIVPGTGDGFSANVVYRQVGQGVDTTVNLPVTGDYLISGYVVTLTNINPAFPIVGNFLHSATVPSTGGSLLVDAIGVETPGAL